MKKYNWLKILKNILKKYKNLKNNKDSLKLKLVEINTGFKNLLKSIKTWKLNLIPIKS